MQRKIILTIALVAAGVGIIVGLVMLPTIREIQRVAQAIHAERTDLEIKYQRGQLIKKITAEFNEIKPDKDRLFTLFVPANREIEAFITPLERLAVLHQVEFTPDPRGLQNFTGPDAPLPLTLTLRGNFINVLKYLVSMERLPAYFNISTVSIRGTNPDRGDVVMALTGQAFRLPYQPPPPALQPNATTTTPNGLTPGR